MRYTPESDGFYENEPQYGSDAPDIPPTQKAVSFARGQLLTLTRTAICLLTLGFAFTARAIGGSFYANVASAYFDSFNASLFTGEENSGSFTDEASITETSRTSPDSASAKTAEAVLPLASGRITSPYGEREENGETQFHKGVDIGTDRNSEIFAVFDGEVSAAKSDASYGNYVVLTHHDGSKTLYAHCERLLVSEGELIKAGSAIALAGDSGDADGVHLHLELIRDGKNADPSPLLGDSYK